MRERERERERSRTAGPWNEESESAGAKKISQLLETRRRMACGIWRRDELEVYVEYVRFVHMDYKCEMGRARRSKMDTERLILAMDSLSN